MPAPLFDHDGIIATLTDLATRLEQAAVVGHVHVIGGATMLLTYAPGCSSLRDIDAAFSPDTSVLKAVRDIARRRRWPSSWLNKQASVYASRTPGEGPHIFDHPHLQVMPTPADHLLAMKALSARATSDRDDLRYLIDYLSVTSQHEVWSLTARYFPGTPIPQRSARLIRELLEPCAPA